MWNQIPKILHFADQEFLNVDVKIFILECIRGSFARCSRSAPISSSPFFFSLRNHLPWPENDSLTITRSSRSKEGFRDLIVPRTKSPCASLGYTESAIELAGKVSGLQILPLRAHRTAPPRGGGLSRVWRIIRRGEAASRLLTLSERIPRANNRQPIGSRREKEGQICGYKYAAPCLSERSVLKLANSFQLACQSYIWTFTVNTDKFRPLTLTQSVPFLSLTPSLTNYFPENYLPVLTI
mgnify:CR=1 FL=1